MNEIMNIVVVGHVDHGKSTVIGRLLADTGSLPDGKLEQVKENCRRNSKPFEYAFLIDALKDEQSQGITIDSARVFFQTKRRHYIIIDAPGHIEFLKNMVTGASRAEAALLVIDAEEGVQENSRRHGYMLSMLGVRQVAILVNKMDLVSYSEDIFKNIVTEYAKFLHDIGLEAVCFIPVSGREGDMIAKKGKKLDWFQGKTVLSILDGFKKEFDESRKPFRFPVQDVYKFTKFDDDRRIVAGTIEAGNIEVGDKVVFYPSGKVSTIKSIENFNASKVKKIGAGRACGFTLSEQVYIKRGQVMCKEGEDLPAVTTRLKVNLFWLGRAPMLKDKTYLIKIGTAKMPVVIENIERIIDASNLNGVGKEDRVGRHEVAECILKISGSICFDVIDDIAATSRFVIVDNCNICGGGIIRQALEDQQEWLRDKVFERNYKWIKSNINKEQRLERLKQKSKLVLITGERSMPRKEIARILEECLFNEGKLVYFLAIGSVIHGVDSDIGNDPDTHSEHLRRLAEVANILLDVGVILIVTAIELSKNDVDIIQTSIGADNVETVWVGKNLTTDVLFDMKVSGKEKLDVIVSKIRKLLEDKGVI